MDTILTSADADCWNERDVSSSFQFSSFQCVSALGKKKRETKKRMKKKKEEKEKR